MGDEMTLTQFLDNKWFRLLKQGAVIVVMGASGYIGVRLALYEARIAGVETQVAGVVLSVEDVSETQFERASINDDFQQTVTAEFGQLNSKVTAVQLDVARIVGIVTEMQRRDVAARFIPQQ